MIIIFQPKRSTHLKRCMQNIKYIIKNICKNLINYTFNRIIYRGQGYVSNIREYKLGYFLFHNPRIEYYLYCLKQNWQSFKDYKSLNKE